ncbi:class I SAM-dependent methyltransferase [Candidatus Pelagibacter sp.]|nr:class I SAM-dependent methyltransferase [Candidatus Pelagibacter sp.]
MKNAFENVVRDFGEEWDKYDYSDNQKENLYLFNKYFDIFPYKKFNYKNLNCLDVGCGSGRWAKILSKKVKHLTLLDPSEKALKVAKKNLRDRKNVKFINKSVGDMKFKKKFDFIYSIGVLHHIPDINDAIRTIAKNLKKNQPFLIYLYYNLDNKPLYFKIVWSLSELIRAIVSKLPFYFKYHICNFIAVFIYYPLALIARIFMYLGLNHELIPLGQYFDKSFYVMRTDALDRFGTKYEKRYSKKQIKNILEKNGFKNIKFSPNEPYWHAIAIKR